MLDKTGRSARARIKYTRQVRRLALAAFPAAFFLLIGSLWIDLPGIYFDEAYVAHALFPAPPGGPNWSVEVFGYKIPVMIMSYAGALKAWLLAPVLALFEPSAASLRIPSLAIAAGSICALFFFADQAFGRATALAACWLIASDPTFLFTARLDWGPVAVQQCCSIAGAALLLSWAIRPTNRKLFLGFLILGLGIFDKLSFHWLIVAHGVAAVAVFRKEILQRIKLRVLAVAAAGFFIGASPLVAYRLIAYQPQFIPQLETDPALYQEKFGWLPISLDGTLPVGWMLASSADRPAPTRDGLDELLEAWFGGQSQARGRKTLLPQALLLSLLALPWTLRTSFRPGLLYILIFSGMALVQMITIKAGGALHHQVLLHPFPQLFIAASIGALGIRFQRVSRIVNPAAAAALIAANLLCIGQLYRDGLRFGGAPLWSEAIYSLHHELAAASPTLVVIIDWGIDVQLRYLSRHKLPAQAMSFPWDWNDSSIPRLQTELDQGRVIFVSLAKPEDRAMPQSYQTAVDELLDLGLQLRSRSTITDRQHRPIYQLLSAEPQTKAAHRRITEQRLALLKKHTDN